MAKKAQPGYTLTGNVSPTAKPHGVLVHVDPADKSLNIKVPLTAEALKSAPISASGKNALVGNTAGFVKLPGTNLKLNVTALVPVGEKVEYSA
jgi:hypothetical protein